MTDAGIEQGYLVLADISGYTSFLTGTELDHASGVIENLIGCIVDHMPEPLRVVKLEGDAAFAYALGATLPNAERLVELVEACYVGFRDRIDDITRQTTCKCAACANVGTLDLKFVAHFGEFVVQRRSGGEDLVGKDVVITHRLLKNRVTEQLGISAYLLLTGALVARMPNPPQLRFFSESYDAIGTVDGMVEDLEPVVASRRQARRVVVTPDEADFEVEIHMAAARAICWDWYTTPERMVRFEPGMTGASAVPNEKGRTGIGSELHCAHGAGLAVNHILDWKPFDYFTQQVRPVKSSRTTPPACRITTEFLDRPDGTTTLRIRAALTDPGIALRLAKPLVRRGYKRHFLKMEQRFAELAERGQVA